MGDLMRQGLPEKPKMALTIECASAKLVTDIDTAMPDAHAENVCAREIRERDFILSCICRICGYRQNSFRFVPEQAFDWLILDNRNTWYQ
jgi:hypothetical protein